METNQPSLELPETFDQAGWRMDRFELLNWGTFDGRVSVLRTEMLSAAITGPNEAGKTTIVDGLTTLLTPPMQRSYNMASGTDKAKDRKEETYIRGVYGEGKSDDGMKQISLRSDGTPTALLLVLRNVDSNDCISIGRICWSIDHETNGFFFLGEKELSIAKDIPSFSDTRTLETRVGKLPGVETFGNSHRKMALKLTRLLRIDINALILFGRVISVRQTGDINSFIREHMLEAIDVTKTVEELFTLFAGITEIRQSIDRAQQQIQKLAPVAERRQVWEEKKTLLNETQEWQGAATLYFPLEAERLAVTRLEELGKSLAIAQSTVELVKAAMELARTHQTAAAESLKNSEEGRQLNAIKEQIEEIRQSMANKQNTSSQFYKALAAAELRCNGPLTEQRFNELTSKAKRDMGLVLGQYNDACAHALEANRLIAELKSEVIRLRAEVADLAGRTGRIRGGLAQARRAICDKLKLSDDELPFAAELIDVQESAEEWRPAFEVLLNGFGRSLLVPKKHYREVVAFVRQQQFTDLKLVFLEVDYLNPSLATLEPNDRGRIISKLRFKPHDALIGWVAQHVRSSFRHMCCRTNEELYAEPYAITVEPLIRSGISNIKDSRRHVLMPENYILGWQNENLRETIGKQIEEKMKEMAPLTTRATQGGELATRLDARRMALHIVSQFQSFRELDSTSELATIAELEGQHKRLLTTSNTLRELQNTLTSADTRLKEAEDSWSAATGDVRLKDEDIKRTKNQLEAARSRISKPPPAIDMDAVRPTLNPFTKHKVWSLENINEVEREVTISLTDKTQKVTKDVDSAAKTLRTAMADFLSAFPDLGLSMKAEAEYAPSFLALLQRLKVEDLPAYHERLRSMMGKFTQGSLSTLQRDLRDQVSKDKETIRTLNTSLKEIGYSNEEYLVLKAEDAGGVVQKFKAELAECLSYNINANDEDREKAFEATRKLVEKLKADKAYRDIVLDTRKWITFYAKKVNKITGQDVLGGAFSTSGGRSGGGRTKLTFTILAAAIAKQYGLLGPNKRNAFRLVIVDEMFGVTDEGYSRYALDLFHRFGLQLICVTPLSPSARVVDEFAHTLHLVTKPDMVRSKITTITVEQLQKERALLNN